ncbi:MAG: SsrA-binding protein SmpB [Verrucomicrobia bacterium]|nr:SsrA-binding protein SmpB [Verrucomicrobiota bacterium]
MSKKKSDSELVSNRKATHDYEILETYEAGIALLGTEIKSLRGHGGSLQDSYVLVTDSGDVILKNASIAPYRFGNLFNHEERRDRKLLLHKREIAKLKSLSQEKGLTLIPLGMYLKNGFVKVKVAVAKGKRAYDKRAALKEREHKRDIDRAMKDHS